MPPVDSSGMLYVVGWVGMIGLVMSLHFGLFHVLSCVWRGVGVDARPLMDKPLASATLSEFWGRRWNTAFRDLTHRFMFRPLNARFNAPTAVMVGFVFSGLIHDLVISLPAGGGYGGPTVYFVLQGVTILMQRTKLAKRSGLNRGWKGWAFTWAVLILPLPLLFHPPFVLNVIVPFMKAMGGL